MHAAAPQIASMTESSRRPAARVVPRDGDIVVTREHASGTRFAVRQLLSVNAQMSTSTREEAVRQARSFAQKHGVDVWYTEDSQTYQRLEAYRPTNAKTPNAT